eukprot:TRINITY_DN1541_c0_g1_i6.p4 TRINITY_DN1541_c0_g1~~TRINITY_DN1541_c0_g1_i6.p4  ORF type:complete len:111 (-),score=13.98 TRINITY_DN1541_c0_g1_i6:520-852(-)
MEKKTKKLVGNGQVGRSVEMKDYAILCPVFLDVCAIESERKVKGLNKKVEENHQGLGQIHISGVVLYVYEYRCMYRRKPLGELKIVAEDPCEAGWILFDDLLFGNLDQAN